MILTGNCLDWLPALRGETFDCCITDPPYELGFMGKTWDRSGIAYSVDLWREVLRVLKPGGHLLSFGGSRTYHRMASAIEDAGFEVRDQIMWVYGSGFPKSKVHDGPDGSWSTTLKPSHEPIVLARKPFSGAVERNVQTTGCGGLWIDSCRIGDGAESRRRLDEPSSERRYGEHGSTNFSATPGVRGGSEKGRWPANLIHDGSEDVTRLFPMQKSGGTPKRRRADKFRNSFGAFKGHAVESGIGGTSGSAARFFYSAKASSAERGEGNSHPTVKPLSLMAYLCRLVAKRDGIVLDPFAGSGSTWLAAITEGRRFVGIELNPEYVEIARARAERHMGLFAEGITA